jgi:hypothetical protein
MKTLNITQDANIIGSAIKGDPRLPYKKGKLQRNIKTKVKSYYKTKEIKVNLNGDRVPYAKFLEEGTAPHDIPHAFGYGSIYPPKPNPYTHQEPYGVGGRFNGKWHPGSTKHKGFIETIFIYNCLSYYVHNYDVIKIERN